MSTADRREFLKRTGQGAVAATALAAGAAVLQARDANERFVVAVIGPGGMGSHHVELLSKNKHVQVAYVCDVDEKRLARRGLDGRQARRRHAQGRQGPAPRARRQGGRRGVDRHARPLARPGHDPGLRRRQARLRRKAVRHNIREGRLMIEAARRNKRVVQVGTQSRSTAHVKQAMEKLQERRDRRRAGRQGLEQPAARVDRPRQAERAALDARLRPVDRARAAGALSDRTCCRASGGGGTTSAPATWATTACTTSTLPLGAGRRHASLDGRGPGRQVFLRRRPAVSRHAVPWSSNIRATARWGTSGN